MTTRMNDTTGISVGAERTQDPRPPHYPSPTIHAPLSQRYWDVIHSAGADWSQARRCWLGIELDLSSGQPLRKLEARLVRQRLLRYQPYEYRRSHGDW